jgi:hypothetical protein
MPKGKIDFNKVGELVFDFANDILKDLQSNLRDRGINATDNLSQSITFEPLHILKTGIVFELMIDSYYKYVDKGVKGKDSSLRAPNSPYQYGNKLPPVSKLRQWIRDKPLMIKTSVDLIKRDSKGNPIINKKTGKIIKKRPSTVEKETIESEIEKVAFLMAEGIRRKGLKATNFYSDVVNEERFDKFRKEIAEAFKQDIIISIKE